MKTRLRRLAIHVLVFSIPFLIGLGGAIWVVNAWMESPEARPPAGIEIPGLPVIDSSLPTAVILVDPERIEPTGLLVPYGILAGSGAMNVLTVAPDRVLLPIRHGVDFMPHVSF